MKKILLNVGIVVMLTSLARADFNPVPITPGSFTADVVVENTAPRSFPDYVTATMDGGTNNNSWVWYERGFDPTRPSTGLPQAGSTFTALTDANRSYRMAPNFATNDVLVVFSGVPSGTLTVTTPTALTALSLLNAGGGSNTISFTIHYQGGGTQTGTLIVNDWFDNAPTTVAWNANGRVNTDNGQLGNTYGTTPKLFYSDIALTDTVNPVTSIDFSSTGGNRSVLFALSGSTGGGVFNPVNVSGFNRDMIVEAGALLTGGLFTKCNVIMDSGATNITGNTWYESGFNTGAPKTGLPVHGTSITNGSPSHVFTMPPTYSGNDVMYIGNYAGYQTGTYTLAAPTACTALSFLNSSGNGSVGINVTVHYADATSESFSFSSLDWFDGATAFYAANGRFNPNNLGFDNVNNTFPKLFNNDITLGNTASAVTSVDFTWASGGRAMIFAVAGQTTAGGTFAPFAVTGYNADGVVEAGTPIFPAPLYSATTATMDGGTNNTANTWYERGYYRAKPSSGLPPAGSIIDSLTQPDHHYQLPSTYVGNNAIFVDSTFTNANITIASPATYSAFSFLSATANGRVTNQCIMQYADGTTETNTFISQDWFDQTPYAFTSLGRINLNTRTINNDPGRTGTADPRLYEAQFALGNVGSPVTNVIIKFLGAQNATGRMFVFAVSATAGAVPPIITAVSPGTLLTQEGSNVVLSATLTGGTQPFSYQWQASAHGSNIFANISNGGSISGATTSNLTFTSIGWTNTADYRLVVTNVAGFAISPTAAINVISGLPDVTTPGDTISFISGTVPVNENETHAIDNDVSKYLNFSTTGNAPFVGPVGIVVKPSKGNSIVTLLRFYTANDAEGRDPADYLLEGSLDGSSFTPISGGSLALPAGRNASPAALNPLTQYIQEIRFANTSGYAYYRLSFTNVKDNVNNNSMQIGEVEFLGVLNSNSAPNFTVFPGNTTANEGTTATFYSSATGASPLTYQWYDVTAGDPGVALSGQTSANLVLNGVTAGQNGSLYRVVATNPYGSVTNPAPAVSAVQLTVVSGPIVINQDLPSESVFYAGRTVSLTAGIGGTSPSYQWQSNGVNLADSARFTGTQSNVLTIANVQFSDAADYQLQSSNSFGGPVPSALSTVYVTAIPTFHTNGAGWVMNGGVFVSSDVMYLTTGGSQARSAFFNAPLYIGAFTTAFTYQDVGGGGADGFALILQNAVAGTAALGTAGGGLGYSGITPSVGLEFNIYSGAGIAFRTNGITGTPYVATTPVDISSGDPIDVSIRYLAGTLQLSLSNTVTTSTFTTNIVVGDLTVPLGTNTAYVGITGASGGISSNQQLSNFRYAPIPTLAAQNSGGSVILSWPAAIGGFGLQSNSNLGMAIWSNIAASISQVGNLNQAIVSPTNGPAFYRLVVPMP